MAQSVFRFLTFTVCDLKFLWLEGTRVAQTVKHLTLDFSSGHDPMVREIEPCIGLSDDRVEAAWDSLSPSLSPPPSCARALSLSQLINKLKIK